MAGISPAMTSGPNGWIIRLRQCTRNVSKLGFEAKTQFAVIFGERFVIQ
jgi:hypothetical protein